MFKIPLPPSFHRMAIPYKERAALAVTSVSSEFGIGRMMLKCDTLEEFDRVSLSIFNQCVNVKRPSSLDHELRAIHALQHLPLLMPHMLKAARSYGRTCVVFNPFWSGPVKKNPWQISLTNKERQNCPLSGLPDWQAVFRDFVGITPPYPEVSFHRRLDLTEETFVAANVARKLALAVKAIRETMQGQLYRLYLYDFRPITIKTHVRVDFSRYTRVLVIDWSQDQVTD